MTETRTDPKAFVDGLVDEMKQLFDRLEEGETLEAESGGDVAMVTLLKLALESELEAAELAGSWIASTPEPDVKSMFARQAADEMKHYEMIRDRLLELGESEESLSPSPTRSALYQYLQTLRTTPERIAA
ncbi:MAG: ferritin-like domain-containing protein, partial [Acidobacteriota bacterium]